MTLCFTVGMMVEKMDTCSFMHIYISFLLAQVCKQLIESLNNDKDKMSSRYQAELEKSVKSSTDVALKHAKEQRQTLDEAVLKLQDEIKRLGKWQEKAVPLM